MCIYHFKCKSLSLYLVQKSFYSHSHSLVTRFPSFAFSPFLTISLSLSLMLEINLKLIDYCLRVWQKCSLSWIHLLWRCLIPPPHQVPLVHRCAVHISHMNTKVRIAFEGLEHVFKVFYHDRIKGNFLITFSKLWDINWRHSEQLKYNKSCLKIIFFYIFIP